MRKHSSSSIDRLLRLIALLIPLLVLAAAQVVASQEREAVYVYERRSRTLTLLRVVIRLERGASWPVFS
jgi:hypothetical protein